ncbi:MAG TPA: prephenate dehydrogenase/arogenate dehydrogenase family protein [Blastocatellia bacterium]|jgi:prephenate dehydrogenase|nr:prephenate dehydrogenase/arogenate dehydrogenase family protein [Blastocatellia bacterium]
MRFNHLAIVGVGLIGGSFALAARRAGLADRITGWGGKNSLSKALANGVIDGIEDCFDRVEVSNADLVYLSAPIGGILGFLRERGALIKPGAIVTDAGSTKREICRAAQVSLPPTVHFVGGHPMAGSHRTGIEFARADLFEEAPYAVVNSGGEDRATSTIADVVQAIGARLVMTTAEHHDRIVARLSHVPQLLATALAVATADSIDEESSRLAGPGFKDMTRLASSPWSIWWDICQTNADEITEALAEVIRELEATREAVTSGDSAALFEAFQKANESARRPSRNHAEDTSG